MKRYVLLILVLSTTIVGAKEPKGIDIDFENISGQYAECAAYFRLVYHAMQSSNEEETANAYRQQEDAAMFYSLLLANEGRSKDVAIEVTNSRIEMYMKKMKQEVNNRNENISILINKYHFGCEEAMENPSSQVAELLQTKINELATELE